MNHKIQRLIEAKVQYWVIEVAIFILLLITNYGFLTLWIPMWGCHIITMVLVVIETYYIAVVYRVAQQKYYHLMENREKLISDRIDHLQNLVSDLNKQNIELQDRLLETIHSNIEESTDNTIQVFTESMGATNDGITNRLESLECSVNERIESNKVLIQKIIQTDGSLTKEVSENPVVAKQIQKNEKEIDAYEDEISLRTVDLHKNSKVIESNIEELNENGKKIVENITESKEKFRERLNSRKDLLRNAVSELEDKIFEDYDTYDEVEEEEINEDMDQDFLNDQARRIIDRVEENIKRLSDIYDAIMKDDSDDK